MDTAQSEEKAKLKREKSREAIALALRGKWEKAAEVNLVILRVFPDDVEAFNRLGKAYLELGCYPEARTAFENAAKISPYNTISKKNLERLAHLEETTSPPKHGKIATPYLSIIEKSGKSVTTQLRKPALRDVLAKMAAGDRVRLETNEHAVIVTNDQNEYLGKLEPKLGMRLTRLLKGGNCYDAAVISINRQDASIAIWETYRHRDLSDVCSFPTRSRDDYGAYWKAPLLQQDIDNEMEGEETYPSSWRQSYVENPELSSGEESSWSRYAGKSVEAGPGKEEDE
jgi:tetratricopeptide (TPR) repeat protein